MRLIQNIFLIIFLFSVSSSIVADNKTETNNDSLVWLKYPSDFHELVAPFKGKIIYIDVMASWCRPCIEEIKYYKELEDFFDKEDIVKLFITIDDPNDIKNAFQIVNKNDIKGYFTSYHPLPGKTVKKGDYREVIEKMFMSRENPNSVRMSVPQYIIVDKNGNVVEYKASRPSDAENLKRQLSGYLN